MSEFWQGVVWGIGGFLTLSALLFVGICVIGMRRSRVPEDESSVHKFIFVVRKGN